MKSNSIGEITLAGLLLLSPAARGWSAPEMNDTTVSMEGPVFGPKLPAPSRPFAPGNSKPEETVRNLLQAAKAPIEKKRFQGAWITSCGAQSNALTALGALGPNAWQAIPDIIRLGHKPCVQEPARQALEKLGSPDSSQWPQILNLLNDKDPDVRRATAEYFGTLDDENPTMITALGHALNDPVSIVRLSAMASLEKVHPEGDGRLPFLKSFLKDESREIRETAVDMIGQLHGDDKLETPLLEEALNDPESRVVLVSARILAKTNPTRSAFVGRLIQLASRKNSFEGPIAAEILKGLNSSDKRVAQALEPYEEEARLQRIQKSWSEASPEERAKNAATLKVLSVKMARDILREEPVHPARAFASSVKQLYCWTEVALSTAPASLKHRWYLNDKLQKEVELEVVTPTAKVWSMKKVKPGHWRVDVLADDSSEPLATIRFTVATDDRR